MTDKALPICKIYKVKDDAEEHRVHKRTTFDLPMRVLIVGKSQLSGKTSTLVNLLLRPFDESDKEGEQFYMNDFEGDNIYIVCPSTDLDSKWKKIIHCKRIPEQNIYTRYDEQELEQLYTKLELNHYERKREGKKPVHSLVVFDDCSFSGDLKNKIHGVMSKFGCNSRHLFVSIIVTSQKYSDISTTLRENATAMMLYNCSYKQKELIYGDVGEQGKKEFIDMFNKATHEKHSFMVVNFSNDAAERFLDSNFQPLSDK